MVASYPPWRAHASINEPERSGWFYVELLHLAAVRAPARGRVLFVGCGAGVALRQFARVYPGVRLDLVESDAEVLALARRWFDLDAIPDVAAAIDDGAAFVARAPAATWDAIIVDAFDGTAIASPFVTRAFFAAAHRALRPGGGLALNLIGALAGAGPVRDAHTRARAELEDVRLVPVLDPDEAYAPCARRNVVLVAPRNYRAPPFGAPTVF